MSRLWWLGRRSYVFFVLRELSSIFVAWSVVFLLLLIRRLPRASPQYRDFLDWRRAPGSWPSMSSPWPSWCSTPSPGSTSRPLPLVVKLRGQRVPPAAIAGGAYAGWLVVTALVVALVVTR